MAALAIHSTSSPQPHGSGRRDLLFVKESLPEPMLMPLLPAATAMESIFKEHFMSIAKIILL